MIDGLKNLLGDIADIYTEIGTGLSQNAEQIANNPNLADKTPLTVYYMLTSVPYYEKIGELLSDMGDILRALVDAL